MLSCMSSGALQIEITESVDTSSCINAHRCFFAEALQNSSDLIAELTLLEFARSLGWKKPCRGTSVSRVAAGISTRYMSLIWDALGRE